MQAGPGSGRVSPPSWPPVFPDVGKLEDAQNRLAVKQLIKEVGKPRNFGLTDAEKVEEERRAAEELLAKEAQERAERQRLEASEAAEKTARWEQWVRGARGGLDGGRQHSRTSQKYPQ